MAYHYLESGLDYVWLENGYTDHQTPYGDAVSIAGVRALHAAIGRWIVSQPRTMTGAEFRFLRVELDLSQRSLAVVVGTNEQSIAKWEKAGARPVANKAAERLLRLAYINYLDGKPEFSSIIDRLTQLDAEIAEYELRLSRANDHWEPAAA